MTDHLSKTIDDVVDRIDALIIQRAERADFPNSGEVATEFRTALADTLCDFVAALKDEFTETFATR